MTVHEVAVEDDSAKMMVGCCDGHLKIGAAKCEAEAGVEFHEDTLLIVVCQLHLLLHLHQLP